MAATKIALDRFFGEFFVESFIQDRDPDGNDKISYENFRDIYRIYEVYLPLLTRRMIDSLIISPG